MSEGAVTLDSDGTILYCNRRLAVMLQLPLEKLIGTPLASYVSPEDAPFFAGHVAKCVEGCDKREISLMTEGGGRVPVLISCCAGEFSGRQAVSVIVTDITSRKQAERTIIRLNRLYALLSGTNHAIVHARDPLDIFREFCAAAVDSGGFRLATVTLLDRDSGELKIAAASGETAYLDGPKAAEACDCDRLEPVSTAMKQGSHYICNDFYQYHSARAHGLYAVASVPINQKEETIGALTLYADEKEFFDAQQVELLQQVGMEVSMALESLHQSVLRQEAEQALQKETYQRLRTVEELRQKEQMLIHQSRQAALGEMIGNIAHQWRQPLNTLGLLVQQAPLYYSLGEVDQEYMEHNARKSMELIEHMSRTIDDFRNFFRPDKEKVPFSVKEEVVKTISLMEGGFQGQKIEIKVEAHADPVVEGYPNEFAQAVLNILNNARDALVARQVGTPRIVITVGSENGRAVVTIADNAGGVPEEIMANIFDPYFTTKGPHGGTGVGLFMSKTIIEKNMGGALLVRNTESGAEFRIEV